MAAHSKLAKKFYSEPIDLAALRYVLDHVLPGMVLTKRDRNLPVRLRKMLASIKHNSKTLRVSYTKKIKDATGKEYGRDYSKLPLSFQNLNRTIRNALVNHYMATSGKRCQDIDVVNCHPVVFLQLIEKHGVKFHHHIIARYVNERETIIEQVKAAYKVDRDTAKALLLALMNYGSVKGWAFRYEVDIPPGAKDSEVAGFITEFQYQFRGCTSELMEKMPELVEAAKQSLDLDASEGPYTCAEELKLQKRFVHVLLTAAESRVLNAAMDYIVRKHNLAVIIALMYDGCIVSCEDDIDCSAIRSHVSERTEFYLNFTVKPFATPVTIPEDLSGSNSETEALSEVEGLIVNTVKLPTHNTFAELFRALWPNSFAYTDSQNKWYRFEAPRWISVMSNTSWIIHIIDYELKPIIFQFVEKVHAESLKVPSILDKPMDDTMGKVERVLGSINFKNCIALQLQSKYQVADSSKWISWMDTNPDLLGFDDCVYDVAGREFRDGRPEDMISMSCGHKRSDVEFFDEGIANSIYDVITDMFDDQDMFSYVWGRLSSCVSGRRPCDAFDIWTGKGRNGKGVIKALMAQAYGGYYYEPDALVFTTKRQNSSGPCPELAKFKGKRCCMTSEANGGETLQLALLKKATGGDPIQARELHKSPVEILPTYNLFLLFNVIPSIDDTSNATKRRLRVNNFPFEYFENPDPEDRRQKQMVEDLRERFGTKRYGATALGVMIKWFETHGHLIPLPESVLQASKNFMLINDPLKEFMSTHFVKGGDKDYVYVKEIVRLLGLSPYKSQLNYKSNSELVQNLTNKGFISPSTRRNGYFYIKGIKVKPAEFLDCKK